MRFLFVTTKRSDYGDSEFYEIEDIQNISALWYLYSEGYTPPVEFIDLTLESANFTGAHPRYKTYMGLGDIRDFMRLMKTDKDERLFAQNVRTNLHSKLNEGVKNTYEKEPDIFWLCNNGIYIVCSKVIPSGNTYRLRYPSVINGSQTLHSILESEKRHECKVLVRILEMDVLGDPELLASVVRRTNSQNAMNPINLTAHDPYQLNIATYLDRFKLFYERREKEWLNEKRRVLLEYKTINIKKVAQWLAVTNSLIGLGTARNQVAKMFEEENYQRLFSGFDRNFQSRPYETLGKAIWAGLFVDNAITWLPQKTKSLGKIARLMLVKFVFDAIEISGSELGDAVADALREHRFGKRHIPQKLLTPLKNALLGAERIQKEERRKRPNLDFSNFFKRNELIDIASTKICSPTATRGLARTLNKHVSTVE